MLIKNVNKTTVDVFLDNGWETWGRFKVSHKDNHYRCFQVGGQRFSTKDQKKLEASFNE